MTKDATAQYRVYSSFLVMSISWGSSELWLKQECLTVSWKRQPLVETWRVSQNGWATDGMILYRTSDGGQRWTRLSPGASFKHVTSLDFVSSTLGWSIGGRGRNSSLLLKTSDGGQSWTPIPLTIS
ncbi:MAG TPA: hypothetical protein VEU97_01640 [Ktedonobacteraceae bacterium]|nr:hypothetical protein [Ktedonobacteraceae bacterium]